MVVILVPSFHPQLSLFLLSCLSQSQAVVVSHLSHMTYTVSNVNANVGMCQAERYPPRLLG